MIKIKHGIILLSIITGIMLLTGCNAEESVRNNTPTISTKTQGAQNAKKQEMKDLSINHELTMNEDKITVTTKYSLPIDRFNDWFFTINTTINEQITANYDKSKYKVKINNLYSDVTTLTKYAQTDGLRQDSANLSYSELTEDGITIDNDHPYEFPFMVESINQNQTSVTIYNGYGSSETTRITESDLAKGAKGAEVNTVWTLLITDIKTGNTYMKIITDNILLAVKDPGSNDEKKAD